MEYTEYRVVIVHIMAIVDQFELLCVLCYLGWFVSCSELKDKGPEYEVQCTSTIQR